MTAMASDPTHVVTRGVVAMRARVAELAGVALWSMGAAEAGSTLVELTRLAAQVAELQLRVAAHARSVGVEDASGATSAAAWWAHTTHLTRREAQTRMRLAQALDTGHEPVREALAAGELVLEQATVIVRAVQELPEDLDPELLATAEVELVGLAAEHDATALRVLGRRILDLVAPEVGEAHEARMLAAEEHAATAAARLTMTDDGHGRVHGRFTLPSAQGAMLRTALLGFAAPKHRAAVQGSAGEHRPSPQRLGHALMEYVERFPTDRLPHTGGVNATIVVTIDLDTLVAGTGGGRWTPARASPPPRPAGWRARPGSSPPSSAAPPRSSTSAAKDASTPRPNASPWRSATRAAPPRAATPHPDAATPTTTSPGREITAEPASTTPGCSAPDTTREPTTPPTRPPTYPAGKSPSPDEHEHSARVNQSAAQHLACRHRRRNARSRR